VALAEPYTGESTAHWHLRGILLTISAGANTMTMARRAIVMFV
jgi:hypothetical protein